MKFETELVNLLNSTDQEGQIKLNERLQKASIYFTAQLELIKTQLLRCPLVTESIIVSRETAELLTELLGGISFKTYILASCKEEFDLPAYTKLRQLYRPSEYKFKIYAADIKQAEASAIPNPDLYILLQSLRDEICTEEDKPVYLVANRASLIELCKYLPTTKEDLAKINGFGKAKVESIGPYFLEIINTYMEERGLRSQVERIIRKPKKKSAENTPAKGSSHSISFELFNSGKTIEEIAEIRTLAAGTISSHLVPYIETGELPVEKVLTREKADELEIVTSQNPEIVLLNELKLKCSEGITFNEMRFFLADKKRRSGVISN